MSRDPLSPEGDPFGPPAISIPIYGRMRSELEAGTWNSKAR